MTNLAGIAPIEHTKALTHIMHYPIQVNFNAQISAQFELKFYFNNFSSRLIGCSRQELRLIRTVFMAVQFFLPWYLSGDIKGMVKFLHSFEGAWREPRPCCVQHRAYLRQKEPST